MNASVLFHADEVRKLGGKSASGEGIEDRLVRHPVLLKQDDEIDVLFSNIRDDKETRYRNQLGVFLELFGEAGAWRTVRDRAGQNESIIHQPHLVLFGTTTPTEFYKSLSGTMLNKGLLARIVTVEAGSRSKRQRAQWEEPPKHIIDVAKAWAEFRPDGWGNLSDESNGEASPLVVPFSDEAASDLDAFADECDCHYDQAAKATNEPVMAIWARAVEKATQLALVHACSEHGTNPVIDRAAIRWASSFIRHTVQRTIYMLGRHFHESDFEKMCNDMHAKLVDWAQKKGQETWMPHKVLRKRLKKLDARQFEEAWKTNRELGLIEVDTVSTGGRPSAAYRVIA